MLLDQSHALSSSLMLPLSLVHFSSSLLSSFSPTLLSFLCILLTLFFHLSLSAPLIRFGSTPRSEKNIGGIASFWCLERGGDWESERAPESSFPFHRLHSLQHQSKKGEYRNTERLSQREMDGWKDKAGSDRKEEKWKIRFPNRSDKANKEIQRQTWSMKWGKGVPILSFKQKNKQKSCVCPLKDTVFVYVQFHCHPKLHLNTCNYSRENTEQFMVLLQ